MEPIAAGEQWVHAQVAVARPAFERGDEGLAFSSLADYETRLRAQVAAFLASVDQYIGKTVDEAQELAQEKGEDLCLRPRAHRLYLSARRVHVEVEEGTVVGAHRDTPGWLDEVGPGPQEQSRRSPGSQPRIAHPGTSPPSVRGVDLQQVRYGREARPLVLRATRERSLCSVPRAAASS